MAVAVTRTHSLSPTSRLVGERPSERVGVEVLLVKLAHKKRKDSASPAAQTSLGTSEVPVNPSEDQPPSKAPAISVPSESFSQNGGGGHHAKSYSLVVRVHQSPFTQVRSRQRSLRCNHFRPC